MDRSLRAIVDLPRALDDGTTTIRVPVARLGGDFYDRRYGTFGITAGDVESWQRNLADHFNGEACIDLDHAADKPGPQRRTEAAAWVKQLDVEGDQVMGTLELTPLGEAAIREKRYRYFSPTFHPDWSDEQGQKQGPTLLGGAFTNRPFLRKGMAAITLAADDVDVEVEDVDQVTLASSFTEGAHPRAKAGGPTGGEFITAGSHGAAAEGAKHKLGGKLTHPAIEQFQRQHGLTVDGLVGHQTAMALLGHTAKAKGAQTGAIKAHQRRELAHHGTKKLGADAASDSRGRTTTPDAEVNVTPPIFTLDDSADEPTQLAAIASHAGENDGTVTLSAGDVTALVTRANAGDAAVKGRADDQFDAKWAEKVAAGMVAPAQEAVIRELHDSDPAGALKLLESFTVALVPTVPAGGGDGKTIEQVEGATRRQRVHAQALQLQAADTSLTYLDAAVRAENEIPQED